MVKAKDLIAELEPQIGSYLYIVYEDSPEAHSPSLTYSPKFESFNLGWGAERLGKPRGLPVENIIRMLQQKVNGEVLIDADVVFMFSPLKELHYAL